MNGAVILAAGQGKRMKSDLPKVMHPVLGRPMILRVIESAQKAGMTEIVVVAGYGREQLTPVLDNRGISWVVQEPQLGTAHAVGCALDSVGASEIAVLLGDVPLLEPLTVRNLVDSRRDSDAAVAVLTTRPPDASGYGRIIRDYGDRISRIVEERDATPEQLATDEINTGLMVFDGNVVRELISRVGNDNSQGEYYLTDCIGAAVSLGLSAVAVEAPDWREVAGINDPAQLARATERLRESVVTGHVGRGVVIPDPDSVWIEESVHIGQGAVIGEGCRLRGSSVIGQRSILGADCVVVDTELPDDSVLESGSVRGRIA